MRPGDIGIAVDLNPGLIVPVIKNADELNLLGIAKRITRKNRETGAIEPHDLATFTKVDQVNLIGTFLMTAKCAAQMQTLPRSRLPLVISIGVAVIAVGSAVLVAVHA